jgi:hypothetical protein
MKRHWISFWISRRQHIILTAEMMESQQSLQDSMWSQTNGSLLSYRVASFCFIISDFHVLALRHYFPFCFLLFTYLTSTPLPPSSNLSLFRRKRGSQLVGRSTKGLVTAGLQSRGGVFRPNCSLCLCPHGPCLLASLSYPLYYCHGQKINDENNIAIKKKWSWRCA